MSENLLEKTRIVKKVWLYNVCSCVIVVCFAPLQIKIIS